MKRKKRKGTATLVAIEEGKYWMGIYLKTMSRLKLLDEKKLKQARGDT